MLGHVLIDGLPQPRLFRNRLLFLESLLIQMVECTANRSHTAHEQDARGDDDNQQIAAIVHFGIRREFGIVHVLRDIPHWIQRIRR